MTTPTTPTTPATSEDAKKKEEADHEARLRAGQSVYDPHNQLNADKPKSDKPETPPPSQK